jgi:hypothetical protein
VGSGFFAVVDDSILLSPQEECAEAVSFDWIDSSVVEIGYMQWTLIACGRFSSLRTDGKMPNCHCVAHSSAGDTLLAQYLKLVRVIPTTACERSVGE